MLRSALELRIVGRRAIEVGYMRVRFNVLDQRCEHANGLMLVRPHTIDNMKQRRTVWRGGTLE